MRRLARPTGLSRGYAQHHQQDHKPYQSHHHQHHQRRSIADRKPLSKYPYGHLIYQGRGALKEKYPRTYEVSDLVLDLDAVDSPYVRPYDEEKDGRVQDSKWGYDPTINDIRAEAHSLENAAKLANSKATLCTTQPLEWQRVSDYDIMAAALLLGVVPIDHPHMRHQSFRTALDGIPKIFYSHPNKLIPFLLHRQQMTRAALADPSRHQPDRQDSDQEFRDAVDKCTSLAHLKRVCSRIDRPESGVVVSSASIDYVHKRLLEVLRRDEEQASPDDVLKFVNNMTIKALSTNKDLNRSMCLSGLQLASQLGLLSCILQYLQICVSSAFIPNDSETLDLVRSQTGEAILAALRKGEGTARGTRPRILTLLTGQASNGLASQACLFGLFPDLADDSSKIHYLHIALLGELGAVRLLLHHWRQRPQVVQQESGRDAPDGAEEVFTSAALRCAQILGSVKDGGMHVDLTSATGDINKDAALDWRNVNAVDVYHANSGSEIPRPPVSWTPEQVSSASRLVEALGEPDMSAVLSRMKELVRQAANK